MIHLSEMMFDMSQLERCGGMGQWADATVDDDILVRWVDIAGVVECIETNCSLIECTSIMV